MNPQTLELSVLEKIFFTAILAVIAYLSLWMMVSDQCSKCGSKITFRKFVDRVRQGDEILNIFEIVCLKCRNKQKTYVSVDIEDYEW